MWPKYCSFSFATLPINSLSRPNSVNIESFVRCSCHEMLSIFLQHHISKDSILFQPETHFLKCLLYTSFAPKIWKRNYVKQAPHSEQATSHVMHCREILFTPRCSPGARSFQCLVNFSLRRTVAELWGVKIAQFLDFGLFSPYKTRKTYLPVISPQPMGYITEWFRFFHMVVEGSKGCLPAPEISCDFW